MRLAAGWMEGCVEEGKFCDAVFINFQFYSILFSNVSGAQSCSGPHLTCLILAHSCQHWTMLIMYGSSLHFDHTPAHAFQRQKYAYYHYCWDAFLPPLCPFDTPMPPSVHFNYCYLVYFAAFSPASLPTNW